MIKSFLDRLSFPSFFLVLATITCVLGPNLLPINLGFNLYFFRWYMLIIFIFSLLKDQTLKKGIINAEIISFFFKLFILFWLLYSLIFISFINNIDEGFKATLVIFFAFIYVHVFQYLFKKVGKNWFNVFSWGIFFSYILSICVALWELLTFNHLQSNYTNELPDYAEFSLSTTGFAGNPNNFSVFIVLSSLCLYYLWYFSISTVKILITVCLFVINPIIIFLNESRLGLFIYLLLLFYFITKFYKRNVHLKGVFFVALILVLFNLELVIKFYEELDFASHFIQVNSLDDDSNAIRFSHFYNFFYYTLNTYGFGLGPGQYEAIANNHYYPVSIIDPHNLFVEIGLDYGIYILLIFVILLFNKLIFYLHYNQIFMIFCLLILLLSPVNSCYLNDNITWLFLAVVFNGFNKNHFSGINRKIYATK